MSRDLFNIEAEHGLLGAILLDNSLFDQITGKVSVSDFSDLENAALYQTMLDCHAANQPVDVITLGDQRKRLPSGDSTIAYAAEISRGVPSTASWATYARVVRERAVLRKVVEAAEAIQQSASADLPLADILALGQQAMADLRDFDDGEQDYYSVNEILPGVIDTIDAKFNGTAPKGLTTGLPDLDAIIKGLRPGNMIVVAGLTGSGKTILGLQIAQHITCQLGLSGLVFSMEMTKEELVTRGLASMGGVDLSRLDEGNVQDDDWPRITSAVNRMNDAKLYVNDQAGMTMARIRSIARQCQRKNGLAALVVDYITLIAMVGGGQNRTLEVGKVSTALKNLAKELMVPVIVLAQLNRGPTNRPDKKPRPSDIRDSGQIEQDADVVIMPYCDMESEAGRNGVTELIVGKVRHAKVGSCFVQKEGKFVRFVSFGGKPPSNEEVEMGRVVPFAKRSKGRKDHEVF